MIADEKESAFIQKDEPHSNQSFQIIFRCSSVGNGGGGNTIGVPSEEMKCDSLAEVHDAVVKSFPVLTVLVFGDR